MALTATAIPALPSWDETIVPALRKRLESESRTLSKRMSAISVASTDEAYAAAESARNHSLPFSMQAQKSATAPRPSLQQPRPSLQGPPRPSMHKSKTSDSNISRPTTSTRQVNGVRPEGYKRSRSSSQPFAVDTSTLIKAKASNGNGNGNESSIRNGKPSMDSARSGSPHNTRSPEIKPTRIPKVASRGDRSGSVSSHGHTPPVPWSPSMGNGFGPHSPPTTITGNGFGQHASSTPPEMSQDLWSVDDRSNVSRSRNEPMASTTSGLTSASQQSHGRVSEDSAPPRASMESEEHPFEHWYRGEVSRNGGVGELRVGKRMEMLEIANYGHTLRKATAAKNQSQMPAYATALVDFTRRKRADSLSGMSTRESFYMDDDEKAGVNGVGGYLVDEVPLTDVDGSTDDHEVVHGLAYGKYGFPKVTSPPARYEEEPQTDMKGSTTPSGSLNVRGLPSRQGSVPASRIPGPSQSPRQPSEPRAAESIPMSRGASEPPSLPSTAAAGPSSTRRPAQTPQSKSQRLPRSTSQPPTTTTTTPTPATPSQLQPPQTQKRRAKSPAASTSSSVSKKAKVNKNLARIRDEKNRRSVAEYPAPPSGDEGNLMDAIPSWTQPVYGDEDWDEVVIPVVARKKGLDSRYETASGGPKPIKKNNSTAAEPAPGTFAYDHTKYRPPREDEQIPMDEFGLVDEEMEVSGQEANHDDRPVQPAPFPHYASHEVRGKEERIQELVAVVDLDRRGRSEKSGQNGGRRPPVKEEEGAGCCQCVIM